MKGFKERFFLGVDGCKGGWIVAVLGSALRIERLSSIGEILETYPDYSAFLIDMVIGLRDSVEQLRPDDIARKELKPRGSTLFPVPSREAVYKETYEEQKKANLKTLGKSLPKQASAIIPKIREIDEFMSEHPEFKNRIDESHPELDFARLNGSVLLTRKKDPTGIDERLKVFDTEFLLKRLLNSHDALVFQREQNKILQPAQILCFGESKEKREEFFEDETRLAETGVATRALIEYLAATQKNVGDVKPGSDDIEGLLAIMSEIVKIGGVCDAIRLADSATDPPFRGQPASETMADAVSSYRPLYFVLFQVRLFLHERHQRLVRSGI